MKKVTVNLIRHMEWVSPYTLTAQFPMWWTREHMNIVAAPLLNEIGGEPGLGYTARFKWEDYGRVREFFEGLGYGIQDIDNREHDRLLAALLREGSE